TGAMGALMIIIYASTAMVDIVAVELTDLCAITGISFILLGVGVAVSLLFERTLGLNRIQTVPLFFTTNIKNLGIALLISSYTALDPLVVTTIVTCFLSQQLFSALISDQIS
ncbi:MAG: hypothetical protein ACOCQL_06310, partial [Halolamina sp.]